MDLEDFKKKLENNNEVVFPEGDYDKRQCAAAKVTEERSALPIHSVRSRSFNELEYQAEQNECANMYLDDLGIPKEDANGEKFSTVGRIKYLEQNGF